MLKDEVNTDREIITAQKFLLSAEPTPYKKSMFNLTSLQDWSIINWYVTLQLQLIL